MTNRAILRLSAIFVVLFVVVLIRQAYVQIIEAPKIAARPNDPRHSIADSNRGRILASDGSVLAQTVDGKRTYPYGASLAHVVGYLSARYGTSGLESAYDRALTPPENSGDVVGQLAAIGSALSGSHENVRGADVVTTIVPPIQNRLYDLLSRHARGAGVVLDPRTGAVLAIASVPSFDPNGIDAKFASLQSDTRSPLLARALDGLYPPGSTFKIFTAASALESGAVAVEDTFSDPGYFRVADYTLHDNEGEATGTSDVTRAFALSSNVDFAQIALKMGVGTFYDFASRWDIGQPLNFQLPTSRDRLPPQNDVSDGELAQMGFGQGAVLMTPMHMALIASTIANGGNEPRPYIVRQLVRAGHPATVNDTGTLATPISAETAASVEKMMEAVVQYGTGTTARLPNVRVAGKTGTATNPLGASHSWFVCFAPAQRPRVAIAVIVENGGYGADVALPIVREVMRAALEAHPT